MGIIRRAFVVLFFISTSAVVTPLHAEKPIMKFVYMENYASFCFRNEQGDVIGIQPEIVQYIADQLDITVVHELYPWGRSQLMVENGEADAMLTTPTPARFKYAIFAKEETCPNIWNLFVRKGNLRIENRISTLNNLEDLKNFELIDFIGNGWTKAFMKKADGFTNINYVRDPGKLSLMLANGRGDMVISSSSLMNYHAAQQGIEEQISEYDINWPWTRFHQVIQISRKSQWAKTGVIKAIDKITRKMKKDGVYMKILKKYKSKVAMGYKFETQLNDSYLTQHKFYDDYDAMQDYKIE